MITGLHITNFKSHRDTRLSLGNLTILAGPNGVGKTSALQTLLLLRQSYQKQRLQEGLDLNKPLCDIGSMKDAVYQYADDDKLYLIFELDVDVSQHLFWQFMPRSFTDTFIETAVHPASVDLSAFSLFNDRFQYLSAARLAPQKSYMKDDYAVERKRQISLENGRGELIAHFLDYYGQREMLQCNALKHPSLESGGLLDQTNAWEREICRDINVHVHKFGNGFEMTYSFNRQGVEFPTDEFGAENVGFGVTYALPIIVAILSAKKDSLLLFENPEAHLSPHGQSRLAELMALAAQSGVQIIAETHSDHIINGTLVAVKNFQETGRGISHDKVKIYQFDRDEATHATLVTEVPVSENGRILHPPQGFFDQIEQDLEKLMGF